MSPRRTRPRRLAAVALLLIALAGTFVAAADTLAPRAEVAPAAEAQAEADVLQADGVRVCVRARSPLLALDARLGVGCEEERAAAPAARRHGGAAGGPSAEGAPERAPAPREKERASAAREDAGAPEETGPPPAAQDAEPVDAPARTPTPTPRVEAREPPPDGTLPPSGTPPPAPPAVAPPAVAPPVVAPPHAWAPDIAAPPPGRAPHVLATLFDAARRAAQRDAPDEASAARDVAAPVAAPPAPVDATPPRTGSAHAPEPPDPRAASPAAGATPGAAPRDGDACDAVCPPREDASSEATGHAVDARREEPGARAKDEAAQPDVGRDWPPCAHACGGATRDTRSPGSVPVVPQSPPLGLLQRLLDALHAYIAYA